MSLPAARLTAVGATAQELQAIQLGYNAQSAKVQQALDDRLEGVSSSDILTMLTQFRAGAMFGGVLPFGAQVAVLTGNPLDDGNAISAGTGTPLPVTGSQLAYAEVAGPIVGTTVEAAVAGLAISITVVTPVFVELFLPVVTNNTTLAVTFLNLREDGTSIDFIDGQTNTATGPGISGALVRCRRTTPGAHTYTVTMGTFSGVPTILGTPSLQAVKII